MILQVKYIIENPVEDLDLYFTDVLDDRTGSDFRVEGSDKQIDLVENGSNVPVDEENKKDYVRRVCEWRLHRCMEQQVCEIQ